MNDILRKLRERYATTSPDVATTVERSLIQLSSGIYTEEERFIFELLQNAVDSFEEMEKMLDIRIQITDEHLVFMHNGAIFSSRDIEGLCDVGNGNKTNDTKKIGYKGIGFKSVFMRSARVTVQTGTDIFKFDKEYWERYWEKNWDAGKHGPKDQEKEYLMPWQIIPLEADVPVNLDTKGYNVVTYIHIGNTSSLERKVERLLKNSQFLLFLRCANIRMSYYKDNIKIASIGKKTNADQVILNVDGRESSHWLLYKNEAVEVPEALRRAISSDINTPAKLKSATTFDLSFAIALDGNGKIRKLDEDEAVVYTYLPTSFHFGQTGFPFLVNANFITDAGRQQLHKDSEWNKLIFSIIPSEYLRWVAARLSSAYDNYYDVLPEIDYGHDDELEEVYTKAMKKAVSSIAFIPRMNDKLSKLLAKEAVMDCMGISDVISQDILVRHINQAGFAFDRNCFVTPVWNGRKILKDYGVYIFDKSCLKALFEDKNAFDGIGTEYDIRLVDYLFRYYKENRKEQNELNSILRDTPFLLDEDKRLLSPAESFFPSDYKEQNMLAKEARIIHADVANHVSRNKEEYKWLKEIGVQELNDISFIKTVICKDGYITHKNSVEVTRFLFETNQKKSIFCELDISTLGNIKFLTKRGTLMAPGEMYLGSVYKPTVDIEPAYHGDIFVSEEYSEDGNLTEWGLFFTKFGVMENLQLQKITLKETKGYPLLTQIKEEFEKLSNTSCSGNIYRYFFEKFELTYAPLLLTASSHDLAKIVWSAILASEYKEEEDKVIGIAGWWGISRTFSGSSKQEFLPWALEHIPNFPSTEGGMKRSSQLFANTESIKALAGKYLPVIDVDCEIHDSWLTHLRLRNQLEIEDYLSLLTNISSDKQNMQENKDRISKIYQRLVEMDVLTSKDKTQRIKDWATDNKILSQDSNFVSPRLLSYVTIDGFGSASQVYIGTPTCKDKVIKLMSLMGVRVITEENLDAKFTGKRECDEIRRILNAKISPLAIASFDKGKEIGKEDYDEKKKRIKELLCKTQFYHCDAIQLSYGDENNIVGKTTFASKNEFYYTGNLRPANVEPLLTPLCKYLKIEGRERELFIMMIEDFDGIHQNLSDKGYDVTLMERPEFVSGGTIEVKNLYSPDYDQKIRNLITGFKGEIIVCEKLRKMGYSPVCPSISTEADYEYKVEVNGRTYYCKPNYGRYDIEFETKEGVKVYVEVKATTCQKEEQENMPISYNEISQIELYNKSEKEEYIIARVFGIDRKKQAIYTFKGQLMED